MEEERIPRLQEFSNTTELNRIEWNDRKIGIVTSGASYVHAKEVFGDTVSYLKVGFSWPLPDAKFKEFAAGVEKIYVIEENEPYMEKHIKAMGIECTGKEIFSVCGEINPQIIREAILGEKPEDGYSMDVVAPSRPPALCAGCPHRGIFFEMSKHKNKINVTSDIGCYTLGAMAPLNVGDTVICMGAGISAGIGFDKVNRIAGREKKVFGVVGDSTFFHSGMTGLVDAVYNKSNMVTVILDNRITAMTGHQENPGTGKSISGVESPQIDLIALVKAIGIKDENLRVIDPYDMDANKEAVKAAIAADEPFVIITKQPCALIKDVMRKRANLYSQVNQDKCRKCKTCLKIGCPAISMKDNVVSIDTTMCNGCEVCVQVCPFDAIESFGKEVN
ncbi:MAG TPA: thiamine pyrophosphate-dependent enzyme, partial [Tissierellaceae bacterium]|nr:thiamine pyrophosphate-dependent enzyme [Tissierellaceae bacterium]